MPEMTMTVRWPDGVVQNCYSPSLVLHEHLSAGRVYSVADFRRRSSAALAEASERVRATFGFACTSAAATTEEIAAAAARYGDTATVEILEMHPQLPAAAGTARREGCR